jgi:hypothetical protein
MASNIVIALQNFISSNVTGSSPYKSLKGVKFVDMETDVLWLHTTLGNSYAHFSFT